MAHKDLRIVFMGTPEFAVPSLRRILEDGYTVAGIVTAPDRQSGRGRKNLPSPVKRFALAEDLKVLQPEKLKDPGFLEQLTELQPDLIVVVAFRMLPELVWSLPRLGTFNLHASMLPQYRGAAPIHHAIINGEKESGLTTFFIDDKIDTGKIIAQDRMSIADDETFGELHDRMMVAGADLVSRTIRMIHQGKAEVISQENLLKPGTIIKPAPKISKEFCRINWNLPLDTVHNFIRGLSPHPGAYTYLYDDNKEPVFFKLLKSGREYAAHTYKPGKILVERKSVLKVAVKGGFILVIQLQQTGKRAMEISAFLNGFNFREGMLFG